MNEPLCEYRTDFQAVASRNDAGTFCVRSMLDFLLTIFKQRRIICSTVRFFHCNRFSQLIQVKVPHRNLNIGKILVA